MSAPSWFPFNKQQVGAFLKVLLLSSGLLALGLTRWLGVAEGDARLIVDAIAIAMSGAGGTLLVADKRDYKMLADASTVPGVDEGGKIKVDLATASPGAKAAVANDDLANVRSTEPATKPQ